MVKDDVTIVTAFVDIGRDKWEGVKNNQLIPPYIKRDTATYFERFERLTKLKNDIVCFTETKFFDKIKSIRKDITLIDIDNLKEDHKFLLQTIDHIQQEPAFIKFVTRPSAPEYWSSSYVLINFLKSHFVQFAVENNLIKTTNAAWIDFGYVRNEVYCPQNKTWFFDTKDKINIFACNPYTHTVPIFEIVRNGSVYIQGCHIVAPLNKWNTLKQLINISMSQLIDVGLVDDDQTLLLMSYRKAPEEFELNYGNVNNWFIIFEGQCRD